MHNSKSSIPKKLSIENNITPFTQKNYKLYHKDLHFKVKEDQNIQHQQQEHLKKEKDQILKIPRWWKWRKVKRAILQQGFSHWEEKGYHEVASGVQQGHRTGHNRGWWVAWKILAVDPETYSLLNSTTTREEKEWEREWTQKKKQWRKRVLCFSFVC